MRIIKKKSLYCIIFKRFCVSIISKSDDKNRDAIDVITLSLSYHYERVITRDVH